MCGFVVVINKRKPSADFDVLVKMTRTLIHRGPDDEGYLLLTAEGPVEFHNFPGKRDGQPVFSPVDDFIHAGNFLFRTGMGFRRLAIIDLKETGHQPMSYRNRYRIVYNGEIYNYPELKEELAMKGYQFRSSSDTEVIMAAYDCWGPACLNKFNGMWAFVLYDTKNKSFFVSRDRFGIKPLYYYDDDEHLIFASEIKAILQHPRVKTEPDEEMCRHYLLNGEDTAFRNTVFKNIYRFSPASYMYFTEEQINLAEKEFWTVPFIAPLQKFNEEKLKEYADVYRFLLSDAVRLRLRSDVRVGAALSGGLDSSSVVYFIQKHIGNEITRFETFSNIYPLEELSCFDESHFIRRLVSFYGVKANYVTPETNELPEEYVKMIYAVDTPPNSSNFSGWYTYQLTRRQGVIVTLDGQGADEQVAGYDSYLLYYLQHLPVQDFFKEARQLHAMGRMDASAGMKALLLNLWLRLPGKNKISFLLPGKGIKNNAGLSLNEILWHDVRHNLNTLLHYGDALSMAHSVESRLPFLDYRLVEFLFSVPPVYKIHEGWTKYLCRHAMKELLPPEITWRKDKMGWPNAEEYWFGKLHRRWFDDQILKSTFIKNFIPRNKEVITLPLCRKIRYVNLALWHEVFFNKRYP